MSHTTSLGRNMGDDFGGAINQVVDGILLLSLLLAGCNNVGGSSASPQVELSPPPTLQTPATRLPDTRIPRPSHTPSKPFPPADASILDCAPTPSGSMAPTGKIAFVRTGGATDSVFVVNMDGTGLQPLVTEGWFNFHPSWSPAGDELAYASDQAGSPGMFDLYVTSVDGKATRRLTTQPDTWEDQPKWSPDGKMLAFAVHYFDGSDNSDIYIADRNGADQTRITDTQLHEEYPDWSPTQDLIAFLYQAPAENPDMYVYTMKPDGSERRRLSDLLAERPVRWSPDGTLLAFSTPKGVGYDIYIMQADGSDGHYLTDEEGPHNFTPAWSPNGMCIAFMSTRDGPGSLYVAEVDGSGIFRLTENQGPGWDYYPAWSSAE